MKNLLECSHDGDANFNSNSIASQPLARFYVEEKISYLRKVKATIEETRCSFLNKCTDVQSEIQQLIEAVINNAKTREKVLLYELKQIIKSTNDEWSRQLKVCENGLKWLNAFDQKFFDYIGFKEFDDLCNNKFIKSINQLHTKDVRLESHVLPNFKVLGRINKNESSKKVPKFTIGGSGKDPGKFCRPWGVCADATNRILVADRSNHRIQVFSESGDFLLQFGKEGSEEGQFRCPSGITVDNECRIIVADKDNHRIQVFTYSGAFLFTFGKCGRNSGEFIYPWDVAANDKGQIAVTDSNNRRVQLFNKRGVLLRVFDFDKPCISLKGYDSDCQPSLGTPRGLTFRPDGSLIVTDFNKHQIVVLDETLQKMSVISREGHNSGELFRPQGVACYGNTKFAVADCKNYRIQVGLFLSIKHNSNSSFGNFCFFFFV